MKFNYNTTITQLNYTTRVCCLCNYTDIETTKQQITLIQLKLTKNVEQPQNEKSCHARHNIARII